MTVAAAFLLCAVCPVRTLTHHFSSSRRLQNHFSSVVTATPFTSWMSFPSFLYPRPSPIMISISTCGAAGSLTILTATSISTPIELRLTLPKSARLRSPKRTTSLFTSTRCDGEPATNFSPTRYLSTLSHMFIFVNSRLITIFTLRISVKIKPYSPSSRSHI